MVQSTKMRFVYRLFACLLFLGFFLGSAEAMTISGTISNTSGKSGRIYVGLFDQNGNFTGLGTSIASAGAYTLSGVPSGSYELGAFIDTFDTGKFIASDPANSIPVSVAGSNLTNINIGIGPLSQPTPQPVAINFVNPGDKTAFLIVNVPRDPNTGGFLAEKFDIYWSTTPAPGPANNIGSKLNVPLTLDNPIFIHGLTNGASLYFTVYPYLNGVRQDAAKASTDSPTTIGLNSGFFNGTSTVTGTIHSSGIAKSASTPMMVGLIDDATQRYLLTSISNPANDQAFSITNVPVGTYQLVVFIDMNNNGIFDAPDVNATGDSVPYIVVSEGKNIANADRTMIPVNANPHFGVGVMPNNGFANYMLDIDFGGEEGTKRIAHFVLSGPGISEPISIGPRIDEGNWFGYQYNLPNGFVPAVGQTYTFAIKYSDGGDEIFNRQITRVYDNSIATSPTVPNGNVTTTQPLLGWTAPGPYIEGPYGYHVSVGGQNYWWDAEKSLFSRWALYNFNGEASESMPTLPLGQSAWFGISLGDPDGNWISRGTSFTPVDNNGANKPVITGFSSTGTIPGSTVTITGSGFNGTASNNVVKFNGQQASVVNCGAAGCATQLVVTVPSSVAAGPISVTNSATGVTGIGSEPFLATVSITGFVTDTSHAPVSGVTWYLEGVTPPVSGTTAANGAFTAAVPAGVPFVIRFSKTGYLDVYSSLFTMHSNSSGFDYTIFTAGNLPPIAAGKGMLRSKVRDYTAGLANNTFVDLAGAVVTAKSLLHPNVSYAVSYTGGGASTGGDGIYNILDVEEGDVIAVSASKAGYDFLPRTFTAHAGAVGAGALQGSQRPFTLVSPGGGSYGAPLTVTLTANQPGTIWYTLDGSDPVTGFGTANSCGSGNSNNWNCSFQLNNPNQAYTVKYRNRNSKNILEPVKTVTYTVTIPDTTPPNVRDFNVTSPVSSLTVPITQFSADDNVAVTGYLVTFSASPTPTPPSLDDPNWTGAVPTSFNLPAGTANGTYNLFAWAKDAAGNLSEPSPAQVTVNIQYSLTINRGGTGVGSVHNTNPGTTTFGCDLSNAASCTFSFAQGSPLTLSAQPSISSTFGGWSGTGPAAACSGPGTCSFTLSAPATVTATFNGVAPVKVPSLNPGTFSTLTSAYAQVPAGGTIQALQIELTENFSLGRSIDVLLRGGFNTAFTSQPDFTTINGGLTIVQGSATVEFFKVR